jgi:predicted GNAT family N-acyltransferase
MSAPPPGIEVRRVRDREELGAALGLREAVFAGEQHVSPGADRDGRDEEAIQLVAVTADGAVVGTCRLLLDGKAGASARLGRLCVRADARRRGIAAALLAAAEREALAAGAGRIGMHAQTAAARLYLDAGYTAYGAPFDEEGIEHVGMDKRLASQGGAHA